MKHIKEFENFQLNEWDNGFFFSLFFGSALLKILYNFIKRNRILQKLNQKDLEILSEFIDKWKDSKALIGNIIDNDDEAQIIYEYGGSDNLVVFHIDKNTKLFTFRWEFTQPIFPQIKFSNDDEIEIELDDEEYLKVIDIFNKLKNEKFKDNSFTSGTKGIRIKNKSLIDK